MEAMHCGRQEIRWLLTLAGALLWLPGNGQALFDRDEQKRWCCHSEKERQVLDYKIAVGFLKEYKRHPLLCVAVSFCNSASLLSAPQSVKQWGGFPFLCL